MTSHNTKPIIDSTVIIIFSVILLAIVLALTIRLQRGLLGLVLGGLAVGLTIYWLRFATQALRKGRLIRVVARTEPWNPDVIDMGEEILVVGKIEPPKGRMNVQVRDKTLEVESGRDFRARVALPSDGIPENINYRNGVLEIRIRKGGLQNQTQK